MKPPNPARFAAPIAAVALAAFKNVRRDSLSIALFDWLGDFRCRLFEASCSLILGITNQLLGKRVRGKTSEIGDTLTLTDELDWHSGFLLDGEHETAFC